MLALLALLAVHGALEELPSEALGQLDVVRAPQEQLGAHERGVAQRHQAVLVPQQLPATRTADDAVIPGGLQLLVEACDGIR